MSGFRFGVYEDSNIPMDLIEPGLYLGSLDAAQDIRLLERFDITCVLSITDNTRSIGPYRKNINHRKINLPDSCAVEIIHLIPNCLQFIHESLKAGKNILVHCFAGISRSATMVIAYIMVKYSLNFDSAKNLVREKRSCVWPNQGFERQLKSLDIEIYKDILS